MPKSTSEPHNDDREKGDLRARGMVMLTAFEREEPSESWRNLRDRLSESTRLRDLRVILQELRAMTGAMSAPGRRALFDELHQRFGSDPQYEADVTIVARVRRRGRITSEREYRSVQSYADSISGNPECGEEFLILGGLLDSFMAGG